MKNKLLLGFLALALVTVDYAENRAQEPNRRKREPPVAVEHGKVIEKDGKRYLWGGEDESWHFDITNFRLDPSRLHFGIGREQFQALIQPEFITVQEADKWLEDDWKVMVVKIGEEIKVYPVDLLIRHEVVNDVVNGRPIFASYCILADLWAVYDRRMYDTTLTFAVSGYTYFEPEYKDGRNAFVLWDRETESLWWPLENMAVSGPMIDKQMKSLEEELWFRTTWGELKSLHPNAAVLAPGQTLEPQSDRSKDDPITPEKEHEK